MTDTGANANANGNGNPLAEKRRQRKLEHLRLEAEARQRQEAIRLQQEQERQRLEAERLAEEQRRADELEHRKRRREAEEARIASIERAERDVARRIERRLQLIGAFCTGELQLPTDARTGGALRPRSVVVVSPTLIDRVIPTLSETIVWVGGSDGRLHAFGMRERRHQFSMISDTSSDASTVFSTMTVTRSGHLIGMLATSLERDRQTS
ncbi:hypothetical protein PINS_up003760 [Pythium insidiosum]|nr:hypothetical protein PINS_up003760 [Pythium insidiosum]